MENATSAANTPTSSTPDPDLPLTILCHDPADPQAACPLCRGMGVIRLDVPMGDPRWGKLHRCPNMAGGADPERQSRLRKLSNLGAFASKTLENFELSRPGYTQGEMMSLTAAYNNAQAFAQQPKGWLVFEGGYGTGKTHLAAAIGNARLAQGDVVLFMTTPDLLDHLRGGFSAHAEEGYDETFERVREAQLLILDDLGAENPSQWANEKLFQLLNYRYVAEKPTIITTNTDLDKLDERLASRLRDVAMVRRIAISAPDYRDTTNQRNAELLLRLSPYQDMSFETFDVTTNVTPEEGQNLRNILRFCQEYARGPQGWLVLSGGYSTGKTHLAAAIANYRQQRHDAHVLLMTIPDLLDYLKATFSPDASRSFDELFDTIRNVELLILDDLNIENAKPWAQEKLFQLLDYRYLRRLPTIITTARSLDDIERNHPRLMSRLLDTRICRLVGIQARAFPLRLRGR